MHIISQEFIYRIYSVPNDSDCISTHCEDNSAGSCRLWMDLHMEPNTQHRQLTNSCIVPPISDQINQILEDGHMFITSKWVRISSAHLENNKLGWWDFNKDGLLSNQCSTGGNVHAFRPPTLKPWMVLIRGCVVMDKSALALGTVWPRK